MDEAFRYELKIVPGRLGAESVAELVRMHRDDFFEEYPSRIVNNVYFDTHDLASARQSLSSSPNREKIRLRWYGPTDEWRQPFLEFKVKRGELNAKRRYEIGGVFDARAPWTEASAAIRHRLDDAGVAAYAGVDRAVLANRYVRRYYRSRDRDVRLTIDARMEFWSLAWSAHPADFQGNFAVPHCVVEIKADRSAAARAFDCARQLPFRIARHSKYVIGAMGIDALSY